MAGPLGTPLLLQPAQKWGEEDRQRDDQEEGSHELGGVAQANDDNGETRGEDNGADDRRAQRRLDEVARVISGFGRVERWRRSCRDESLAEVIGETLQTHLPAKRLAQRFHRLRHRILNFTRCRLESALLCAGGGATAEDLRDLHHPEQDRGERDADEPLIHVERGCSEDALHEVELDDDEGGQQR